MSADASNLRAIGRIEAVMIIREMTEEDIPKVYAIELETFSEPWREEDFKKAINDPANHYLVAQVDEEVVGYCGYWGIAGEGDIFNVAVRRENRGSKIGYRMMSVLIQDAVSRGITSLTLEVRSSNEAAIRLYQALGFRQEGIRRGFYSKPKEDAVIMWLKLIQ